MSLQTFGQPNELPPEVQELRLNAAKFMTNSYPGLRKLSCHLSSHLSIKYGRFFVWKYCVSANATAGTQAGTRSSRTTQTRRAPAEGKWNQYSITLTKLSEDVTGGEVDLAKSFTGKFCRWLIGVEWGEVEGRMQCVAVLERENTQFCAEESFGHNSGKKSRREVPRTDWDSLLCRDDRLLHEMAARNHTGTPFRVPQHGGH